MKKRDGAIILLFVPWGGLDYKQHLETLKTVSNRIAENQLGRWDVITGIGRYQGTYNYSLTELGREARKENATATVKKLYNYLEKGMAPSSKGRFVQYPDFVSEALACGVITFDYGGWEIIPENSQFSHDCGYKAAGKIFNPTKPPKPIDDRKPAAKKTATKSKKKTKKTTTRSKKNDSELEDVVIFESEEEPPPKKRAAKRKAPAKKKASRRHVDSDDDSDIEYKDWSIKPSRSQSTSMSSRSLRTRDTTEKPNYNEESDEEVSSDSEEEESPVLKRKRNQR